MVGRRSTFLDEMSEMIDNKRETLRQVEQRLPEIDEEIAVLLRLQAGESIVSVVRTSKPEIIRRLIFYSPQLSSILIEPEEAK